METVVTPLTYHIHTPNPPHRSLPLLEMNPIVTLSLFSYPSYLQILRLKGLEVPSTFPHSHSSVLTPGQVVHTTECGH